MGTLLDPRTRMYRYLVLLVTSLLIVGSYFAYDIIGAIAPDLVEELGVDRAEVGFFNTAYSIAAILALLICGVMIDRLGTRISSLTFTLVVIFGATLVAWSPNVGVLSGGRFVFGAGAEPLVVAQSAILARWFKGKELAFSFGFALTVSRLGSFFSYNLGGLLVEEFGGVRGALWVAVGLCCFSLLANIAYILLDRHGEKVLALEAASAEDQIKFSDVRHFKPSFWFVTLLCLTFYGAIFPFLGLSTDFFVDKWGVVTSAGEGGTFIARAFDNVLHMFSTAGGLSSIIIVASMICAPFAGILVDRYGKRATLMIFGSLMLIPAHLVLGLTNLYPVVPMIVLGMAFVLVPAAMWPTVPLIVKKEHVGTAFGLMTAIQNIGLGGVPWLNGQLRDMTGDYTASQIMFAGLGVLGLIFAIFLKRSDKGVGGVLEAGGS